MGDVGGCGQRTWLHPSPTGLAGGAQTCGPSGGRGRQVGRVENGTHPFRWASTCSPNQNWPVSGARRSWHQPSMRGAALTPSLNHLRAAYCFTMRFLFSLWCVNAALASYLPVLHLSIIPTLWAWYTPDGSSWSMNTAIASRLTRATFKYRDTKWNSTLKHYAALEGLKPTPFSAGK